MRYYEINKNIHPSIRAIAMFDLEVL